ncbi:uncharacterized protein Dana_GF27093 [Drosophila ananassae]|uniref:Uncharacterized protein n=1 Tax=Drosophila ananassae TaxID=7217 RepID=A0A0P8YP30_DROAN|nr:uncharacterized protein Dana_GF27093 [Drosophila ananassae]
MHCIGRRPASNAPPHLPRPCPCQPSAWCSPSPCPRSTRKPSAPRALAPRRSQDRPSTRSHSVCTRPDAGSLAAPHVAQDVTQSKHSEICSQVEIKARTKLKIHASKIWSNC